MKGLPKRTNVPAGWIRAQALPVLKPAALGLVLAFGHLFVGGYAQAETLGRLFSTPEERKLLNQLRREYEYGKPEVAEEEKLPPVEQVTINGVVVRSSGVNASWINGSSILGDSASREGIRVETEDTQGGTVRIMLPDGLESIRLRAGQKVDVRAGAIVDVYHAEAAEAAEGLLTPADDAVPTQ